MNRSFKPASFVFYLLMLVVFFLVGVYAAIWSGAGENQMLASAAIVLGWGFGFGVIAFLVSFYLVRVTPHQRIVKINWVLLVALIVFVGITQIRYMQRQKEDSLGRFEKIMERDQTTKSLHHRAWILSG